MRYTKLALLTFGAGLVLALVAVAAEIHPIQRVASAAMALGIAAIPIGMAVDWPLATRAARPTSRRRGKARTRRNVTPARRHPRKAARSNR
jgi:uncharacterized membrane protein